MNENNIKSLSDYKEEIHRCSKCGLCQAECPLFQATGNECTVSRGQFVMLDGIVRGKLKMNKTVNRYLDLCLKCGKCSDFCPSDIDIVDILLTAKHEYFKNSLEGKIYAFLESKPIFDTALNIIKFFTNIFSRKIKSKPFDTKAVYFGGCISALKPNIKNYVTTLLNKMHIEVIPTDFNCCGMPFLTTGNLERFEQIIKENISKLPDNCEYLITDCASCEWAWKQYPKYLKDDGLKERIKNIKIKSIYELIASNGIQFESKKEYALTYHKPCHTKDDEYNAITDILTKIENSSYSELSDFDKCCGFSSYEHPLTLSETNPIRKDKEKNINNSNADFVITNCVGCLTALKMMKTKAKPIRLISFLKDFCKIK